MSPEAENLNSAVELEPRGDTPAQAVATVVGPLLEATPRQASRPGVERLIGTTLLAGVLASTFLVLFGGLVYVSRHSTEVVDYRVFRGEYSDLRTPHGVLESVKGFSGRGIVQFGLMLLVGFQVVRVMVTGLLFLSNRDWVFVGITAAVLVLLAYGLLYESGLWVSSAGGC